MRIILACVFLALLFACATPPVEPSKADRFLSEDEDREFRETCEDTGCVVVPVPVWEEILRRLKAAMGRNV